MSWLDDTRVTRVPELDEEGVWVRRFTIPDLHDPSSPDPDNMRSQALYYTLRGRGTRPGVYTRLDVDGQLWMSDTDPEVRDHAEVIFRLKEPTTKTVLIHGLGLGMVLGVALAQPHVARVDVVEKDERVARIIGRYYEDPRLKIWVGDALTFVWPPGRRWDVVWHDIWGNVSDDDLREMTLLMRKFGRRAGWQDVWGRELVRRQGFGS